MAATAKPRFGDLVENGWASEDNPTRRGFFVREGKRTGRMNARTYWEITDGKGKFWECSLGADHKMTWAPTARPVPGVSREEVARIVASWIDKAFSCAIPEPWDVAEKYGEFAANELLALLSRGEG